MRTAVDRTDVVRFPLVTRRVMRSNTATRVPLVATAAMGPRASATFRADPPRLVSTVRPAPMAIARPPAAMRGRFDPRHTIRTRPVATSVRVTR